MSTIDSSASYQGFNNRIWEHNKSIGINSNEQSGTNVQSPPSPGHVDEHRITISVNQEGEQPVHSNGNGVEYRESISERRKEFSVQHERTQDRRSLAGTVYGPPIGAPPGHYKRPAPCGIPRPQITHIGSSAFKKGAINSVIEVLLEEPRVSIKTRYRKRSSVQNDANRTSPSRAMSIPIVRQNPKRIRIRSAKLLKTLEHIAESVGFSFLTSGTTSLVFQYPFKLFITLEQPIREKLAQLSQAFQENDEVDSLRPSTEYVPSAPKEAVDIEVLQQLKLLEELFETDLKPMFDMRRDIETKKLTTISYTDLWHLFRYGQEVRTSEDDAQIYRVLRWTGGREPLAKHGLLAELQARAALDAQSAPRNENRGETFIVEVVSFEFDGFHYGPVQKTFVVRKYDGEKTITSLPIFPLAFDPAHEQLRKELIQRGNVYLQLSQADQASHKHYCGLTLDEPQEEVDSQIIVDTKMAMLRYYTTLSPVGVGNLVGHNLRETYEETVNPTVTDGVCAEDGCCDNELVHKDYGWDMQHEERYMEDHRFDLEPMTDPNDLDDDERLLLPPFVYGFVLRSRKWAKFSIESIRNVEYTSGFNDLVLPTGHKETVRALVANHARLPTSRDSGAQNQKSIDLVRGKGKGLVILLHGAPGVGKTSTAECVADTTKRPLFPITCGDIGDTAAEVETNLESSFQLAHKWGCVLLLDEADIFLQKRDKTDIKRNSIVSVFLRALEYYSGILFLTTNRVGLFDPAFRSRIHISLYYPGLQKDATIQIWRMHLARTQEIKGDQFKIKSKEILKFAKEHYMELKKAGSGSWNGRQIRNAFQTAIALAEFETTEKNDKHDIHHKQHHVELSREHFATVARASAEFDTYLKSTLGGQTESDIARLEQTRMDEYSSLKIRTESNPKASKARGKVVRKGKSLPDSEESDRDSEESENSEESEEQEEGGGTESESEEEERVVIRSSKAKKDGKKRK
ncbi:unnamed protein product [Alternaria alternata]